MCLALSNIEDCARNDAKKDAALAAHLENIFILNSMLFATMLSST